nr:serine protease [Candidatus Pantoea persica]
MLDSTLLMESMIVAVILEIFAIPLMGALLIAVSIVPFFLALQHNSYWLTQSAMIVALTQGHSMCYAPQASWFPELFLRCSGITVIWQIGSLIGSGMFAALAGNSPGTAQR